MATKQRGRVASPKTVAIRRLLEETKGKITFKDAQPILVKEGFKLDGKHEASSFGVTKNHWKVSKGMKINHRSKTSDKPNPKPKKRSSSRTASARTQGASVTLDVALQYVRTHGGLKKVEQEINRLEQMVSAIRSLEKQLNEVA